MFFLKCPLPSQAAVILQFVSLCVVLSIVFCCTSVFLLFRCFFLIVDVFPPDLFSLNRFIDLDFRTAVYYCCLYLSIKFIFNFIIYLFFTLGDLLNCYYFLSQLHAGENKNSSKCERTTCILAIFFIRLGLYIFQAVLM